MWAEILQKTLLGGQGPPPSVLGAANVEHRAPIETDTVFRIASTSKQFTAACVVLLELDRKLSFDDDVRDWIPELPEYSAPILIEDLIHHTSGLRDYLQLLEWAGYSNDAEVDEETVMDLITRQHGLNHLPGEEHSYTNTGYFLLSILVERVSGESLRSCDMQACDSQSSSLPAQH